MSQRETRVSRAAKNTDTSTFVDNVGSWHGPAALVFCCGLLLASCATDRDTLPREDAAAVKDMGTTPKTDGGWVPGPKPPCALAFAHDPTPLPAATDASYAAYAWTQEGYVRVSQGKQGVAFELLRLSEKGKQQGDVLDLWPGHEGAQQPQIAAHGNTLAVAYLRHVGVNPAGTCQLGLSYMPTGLSIKEPFLVSDEPSPVNVLNSVESCALARDDEGFVVVWTQITDASVLGRSLFAQRFDIQGNLRGERITLATAGDKTKGLMLGASPTWTEHGVVAAHLDGDDQPTLTIIAADSVRSVPLSIAGLSRGAIPQVQWTVPGLLLRWGDQLAVVDLSGKVISGPMSLAFGAEVAAFEAGYVVAYHDEFLQAHALDSVLERPGSPLGISEERSASLLALRGAVDGHATGIFFRDVEGQKFVALTCGATTPPPLGPLTCPEIADAPPLDDGCAEGVCHALIRLDYLTLGLLGYATMGGPYQPVDAEAAKQAAEAVFVAHAEHLPTPLGTHVGEAHAGVYEAGIGAGDFGAVGWVGQQSGLVLGAAGVVWMGRGSWWAPDAWSAAADLACRAQAVAPQQSYTTPMRCVESSGDAPPHDASDALELALRTNLAATFAARGSFSAHVALYTPAVGACQAGVAEFVVILSQRRAP